MNVEPLPTLVSIFDCTMVSKIMLGDEEAWKCSWCDGCFKPRHATRALYHLTKAIDPTRPVISNEGWEHTYSDILGIHDYTQHASQLSARFGTPEGVDRAFAKLDTIKADTIWWEAGAQPPQYLASGDVVMSSAYNGRIAAVQKESNLKVVWNGGIYDFDSWAIPKGAKDLEAAQKFIAYSIQPQQQKTYSENIAYGPANTKAVALMDKSMLADMPTTPENIANQVPMDVVFWADYGEQLEQRFNAWAAK